MNPISGTWSGVFTYDSEEYQEEFMRFQLILDEKKGILSGQCQDSIEDGGIPIAATIEGFIEGDNICFVKKYPYLIYMDESGEYKKDDSQPHPEIHYHGVFENGMLKGSWEMTIGSFNEGEDIITEQITGQWEMTKL